MLSGAFGYSQWSVSIAFDAHFSCVSARKIGLIYLPTNGLIYIMIVLYFDYILFLLRNGSS